ncbi:hypothetical protein FRC11_010688 [Ceratobasidium sp. 423]|nr:hypothetical protein FRC11_010688 [Ceratobasidium sp. 423]
MPPEDSPLYPLYCNKTKPWTMAYEGDTQSMRDGNNWKHEEIPRHLKEFFLADVGPPGTAEPRPQEQGKELERLMSLLAQKDGEIKELRPTHDNELKTAQEKNEAQKADHDLSLQSLFKTIRDYEGQISTLKSGSDSNLNEVKKLGEQLDKFRSEKELELKEIQDKLYAKDEEISKLNSERDSKIEKLHGKLQAKDEELTRLKADSERRAQESMDKVWAKESEITQLKIKANGAANKTGDKQGAEIDRLREEIRRVQAEYGSLRNHMQLQENTEQAEITTALGDINRLIEEVGQSLSEHVEKHMGSNTPGKDFETRNLLGLFGRVGSELASKVKQDTYLLFEYAVQATVCEQLYTHLFKPFHPSIADDEKCNTFIMEIYSQIVHQVPQSVAGRWRRDAFNSISKNRDKPEGERIHRLITDALSVLLGKIVKIPPGGLLKGHEKAFVKVITKVEQLNRLLKGGVSILGDFQPIAFPFGEAFQPNYMSEVSSKSNKAKQPDKILATVELGLVKAIASGGSQKPEEVILRKAVVFGLPK